MTANTAIRRVNTDGLTPWKPGQSGNPSGRPKSDVGAYIRGHMDLGEWYRRVWAIACDPKDRDKVRALELLVNHAWGAPRQSLALSRDEDDPGLAAMRQLIAAIHGVDQPNLIEGEVIEARTGGSVGDGGGRTSDGDAQSPAVPDLRQ